MTLDECEDAYLRLSEVAFTPRPQSFLQRLLGTWRVSGRFSHEALESAIKQVIDGKSLDSNTALLKDENSTTTCKVFVTTVQATMAGPAVLRTYDNPNQLMTLYDECKIWEACRATSAASTFFDPIMIGPQQLRSVDGGLRNNNPIQVLYDEAGDLWPDRITDAVLISIGTGTAPSRSITKDTNILKFIQVLADIVTDADIDANKFDNSHRLLGISGQLYRFSVSAGLEDVGLAEWRNRERIYGPTAEYLKRGTIRWMLTRMTEKLDESAPPARLPGSSNSSPVSTWLCGVHDVKNGNLKADRWRSLWGDPSSNDITFPKPFVGLPNVIIGLRTLDFGNRANLRAHASVVRTTPDSFRPVLEHWSDSENYRIGCSWLVIPPDDLDFQSGYQNTYGTRKPSSPGGLQIRRQVRFYRPYNEVPTVICWLTHIDSDKSKNHRMEVEANEIDRNGFILYFRTWSDSILYELEAGWLAFSANRNDVVCTPRTFTNQESDPLFVQRYQEKGFISKPCYFVAFNHIDVDCGKNVRLNLSIKDVTSHDIKVCAHTWADSHIFKIGFTCIIIGSCQPVRG